MTKYVWFTGGPLAGYRLERECPLKGTIHVDPITREIIESPYLLEGREVAEYRMGLGEAGYEQYWFARLFTP